MLGMKRAIRWAAENGFDKVAWTPGEVQATRYPEDAGGPKDQARLAGMKGFYDEILPSAMKKYGKKFGARVETTQISVPVLAAEDIAESNVQEMWSVAITPKLRDEALSGQLLYSIPMPDWEVPHSLHTSATSQYPEDYNTPGHL